MRQSFDHQPRHRQIDEGFTRGWQLRIIFAQPSARQKPGEGAFDDPSARQHMKATRNRWGCLAWSHPDPADSGPPVLDDLQRLPQRRVHPLSAFASVGAIRPDTGSYANGIKLRSNTPLINKLRASHDD